MIFVSFGNDVDIVVHYDNNPFRISADTNKDDLECPIRHKVRLADGTLDVCMLWLSELTTVADLGGPRGPCPPKRQKTPFALMNYSFTVANDVNLYISCLFNMQLIALSIQLIPSAADC